MCWMLSGVNVLVLIKEKRRQEVIKLCLGNSKCMVLGREHNNGTRGSTKILISPSNLSTVFGFPQVLLN